MERKYFYTIDHRGNLIHDNTILEDGEYIDFIYKQLRSNYTDQHYNYPYIAHCGNEKNYVRADDTLIIFQRLNEGKLEFAHSLSIDFSREKLFFSREGGLYHLAPVGGIGRLAPQVVMELSKYIQPFGMYYSYKSPQDKFLRIIEPTLPFENKKILRPRLGNRCAGCGQDSPNGLYLSFVFDSKQLTAESWLQADERLEGSLGIMHGGYVSMLLDEVMGKVLSGMEIKAPTANLTVRFRKPTPIGKLLHLRGSLVEVKGRKHFLKGEIFDENEQLFAEAEGLFIKIKPKETE